MNKIEYSLFGTARQDIKYYLSKKNLESGKILSKTPNILYKYTSLNKYAVDNLLNSSLTASMPALFNDLHDSFFRTQPHNSNLEEISKNLPVDEIKKLKELDEKRILEYGSINQENSYVLSLAESGLTELMWSLYAASGKGICIEYNMEHSNLKEIIFPVLYLKDIIDFSDLGDPYYYDDRTAQMVSLACQLCKGNDWSYEKEWRLVIPISFSKVIKQDALSRINIKMPVVKSITLGPHFIEYWIQKREQEDESVERLFLPFCKWVEEYNITLKVARINRKSFGYNNKSLIDVHRLIELEPSLLSNYIDENSLRFY